MDDRLIWIFGSSRSGSTWLLRMLTDQTGLAPMDDPHLGHHLGVWRPISLAWASGEEPVPDLRTLDEIKGHKPDYFFSEKHRQSWEPPLKELIRARFDAQLRAHAEESGVESRELVVKEPGSQAAGLLMSMFPDSRVIFLLRDGRDVVDSWLDAYQDGSWAQSEGAFPLARGGRLAFVRWQASVWRYRTEEVRRAFERHDPDRRVLVRYEDLLADPGAELSRICDALAIESCSEELARIAASHAYAAVSPMRKGTGKETRSANPGGWRWRLDHAEQRAVHEIMGEQLQSFGYLSASDLRPRRRRALASRFRRAA